MPGTILDVSCINVLNLHNDSGRRDCHDPHWRDKETEARRNEATCLGVTEFFSDQAGLETQATGSWFRGLEHYLLLQMGRRIGLGEPVRILELELALSARGLPLLSLLLSECWSLSFLCKQWERGSKPQPRTPGETGASSSQDVCINTLLGSVGTTWVCPSSGQA